jgi:hypothetical protein
MSNEFPIYQVEQVDRAKVNTRSDSEGRFYKYWCSHPQLGRCLFKAAAPDGFTLEERRLDWSEKVAAELGKLMGLPIAKTELALGFSQEIESYISGTLSLDYTPVNAQIISGRRFLSFTDPLYDSNKPDGSDSYNVENVLFFLEQNSVGLPLDWIPPNGVKTGADLIVGYLLFDAWLSATDRHDENWELAMLEDGYRLCPTFDHGDCLGTKLSDQEIAIEDFGCPKLAESSWWKNQIVEGHVDTTEISTTEAFTIASELRPLAAQAWLKCLSQVKDTDVIQIFDQIPLTVLTTERNRFANGLLKFNYQQLILSR